MKLLTNFILGTIAIFIFITGILGIAVSIVKLAEYCGLSNPILIITVFTSVVGGFIFTFAKYEEDEETEGEDNELH